MTAPTGPSSNGPTPSRPDGGTVEISFIVPLFNHLQHTQAMLESLLASLPSDLVYEVILVDDFSTDGTRAWLATLDHPRIKTLLNPENLGYAASNNAGACLASGELLALLNNDLLLARGWLEPMAYVLRHPGLNAGLVGNVQYRVDDGQLDHAGVRLNHRGQFEHIQSLPHNEVGYQRSLALTGACLLIRKADFSSAGGFDDGFVNGCEDYDLCFKTRKAGKQLFVATASQVRHHVSLSRAQHNLQDLRNSRRLYAKWRDIIKSNLATELAKSPDPTHYFCKNKNTFPETKNQSQKPYTSALKTAEYILLKEESEWKYILSKIHI
jgi:GT2 family glycosyltransferase